MIERHQDYQLTVATVPPGGVRGVPLQLDSDAPFALRLVRSRNIGLNGWKFQTPRKAYQSNALRTDWIVPAAPGAGPFPSRGAIVDPEFIYPIGSQIVVDIGNATGSNITNARLLFRGSKLFADGAIPGPAYPSSMRVLPFVYPTVVQNMPVSGTIRDNQLRIRQDADFVFRYGACDPFTLGVDGGAVGVAPVFNVPLSGFINRNYTELYVMLRDESRKAYSNEPIHVNDVFGQGLPNPTGSGANDAPIDFFPGLMTPEIYLPREHSLYFDLFRSDTSGFALNLHFRFGGMKVFPA
jgi:hypothetical protein